MDKKEKEALPVPVAPARGAKAGVRSDVGRGAANSVSYNPVGTGAAWSHNFLNQKPWHPMNFRNQVRKYEHEVAAVKAAKDREQALVEWQLEQEREATMAMLDPAEAKRQRDRAQISFMYSKPPGYEAAQIRDRELADKKARADDEAAAAAAAGAAAAEGSSQQQQQQLPGPPDQQQQQGRRQQQHQGPPDEAMRQRQMDLDKLREDPFAAILAARSALQASDKFVLKSVEGVYGGTMPSAGNHMLLEDKPLQGGPANEIDEAEALLASLDPREREAVLSALAKKKRKAEKAARLEQAEELLRLAGINPVKLQGGSSERRRHSSSSKHKHKSKSSKKQKKVKSHKRERSREGRSSKRSRGRSRSRSGGSGSSSGTDSD